MELNEQKRRDLALRYVRSKLELMASEIHSDVWVFIQSIDSGRTLVEIAIPSGGEFPASSGKIFSYKDCLRSIDLLDSDINDLVESLRREVQRGN